MSVRSAVAVRVAQVRDLAAIQAVEQVTPGTPHWPEATYLAMLSERTEATLPRRIFLAEREGRVLGFAVVALPVQGSAAAELESLSVALEARRQGVASMLCAHVFDYARQAGAAEMTLEVRAGSTAANALYLSLGFVVVGRRPRYYRNPDDDALLLSRPLLRVGEERGQ